MGRGLKNGAGPRRPWPPDCGRRRAWAAKDAGSCVRPRSCPAPLRAAWAALCPRAESCPGCSFCRPEPLSLLVCGKRWAESGRGAAPDRTTAPGVHCAPPKINGGVGGKWRLLKRVGAVAEVSVGQPGSALLSFAAVPFSRSPVPFPALRGRESCGAAGGAGRPAAAGALRGAGEGAAGRGLSPAPCTLSARFPHKSSPGGLQ